MSELQKITLNCHEVRAKMSMSGKGKVISNDWRQNIGNATKIAAQRPEVKANQRKGNREAYALKKAGKRLSKLLELANCNVTVNIARPRRHRFQYV